MLRSCKGQFQVWRVIPTEQIMFMSWKDMFQYKMLNSKD